MEKQLKTEVRKQWTEHNQIRIGYLPIVFNHWGKRQLSFTNHPLPENKNYNSNKKTRNNNNPLQFTILPILKYIDIINNNKPTIC